MANMTFTVRISPRDHELLTSLAAIRNQSVAELSRELLADGIRRLLDPEEIERRLDRERSRLLAAAAELGRADSDQAATQQTP
ncbi:hypothetical protein F3087_00690 [Nocardia colli]|uniref:Ribbon-helix-helix protein, CopG family n=1 Tax=Nocardia colli TaxID=2545717 RepID=A0A5N0EM17_9NOCA|nr:hypothetical protein [Nocardia colli]KAA8889880.1 hypothetical protein F3087_00690 [Nocardia colli]